MPHLHPSQRHVRDPRVDAGAHGHDQAHVGSTWTLNKSAVGGGLARGERARGALVKPPRPEEEAPKPPPPPRLLVWRKAQPN